MDKLILLEKKIKQLVEEYKKISGKYEKLLSEKKFLEEENIYARKLILENQNLNKEKNLVKEKINFILDKISQLKI